MLTLPSSCRTSAQGSAPTTCWNRWRAVPVAAIVPGEVIIQTYLPEDPVIRAVAEHDRSIFTDYDLDQRRDALYPPFVRLVNILVWSANAR